MKKNLDMEDALKNFAEESKKPQQVYVFNLVINSDDLSD
jgi:hypothetical protein